MCYNSPRALSYNRKSICWGCSGNLQLVACSLQPVAEVKPQTMCECMRGAHSASNHKDCMKCWYSLYVNSMGLHKNKYDWGQLHALWITNKNQSLHTQPKDTAGAPRKLCTDVCAVSTLYNIMNIVSNTPICWLNMMVCCNSPSVVNYKRKSFPSAVNYIIT